MLKRIGAALKTIEIIGWLVGLLVTTILQEWLLMFLRAFVLKYPRLAMRFSDRLIALAARISYSVTVAAPKVAEMHRVAHFNRLKPELVSSLDAILANGR